MSETSLSIPALLLMWVATCTSVPTIRTAAVHTTPLTHPRRLISLTRWEAEGLTLVNGKLATNGVKTSWNSKGFRFGVVGFGAQFRPKSGSDVLVVAGNSTSDTGNSTGYMWDAGNSSKSVSALGGSIMVPLVAHRAEHR